MDNQIAVDRCIKSLVKAYLELNTIRARDGIPYRYDGRPSDVDKDYFYSVVEEIDCVVTDHFTTHCFEYQKELKSVREVVIITEHIS